VLERRQSEISRILMPRDVVFALRRFKPGRGVKHQDVRPDHRLDHIEDARMPHQLGRPRKQQVGLHPVRGVALQTVGVLIAQLDRFGAGAQAVIPEALRLHRRQ
jgi:hypothetical protein